MKVHYDIENLPTFRNAIITIGTFDGVHCGHQQIINTLKEAALKAGGESVIITFHPHPRKVVSSAVTFGTVQLLPDGQLIVLMADHQTTGGYPRVAHVITAHHTRMAQMKPGDLFIFRFTDLPTAEELVIKQQQHLLQLQIACKFKLEELLSK